MYFPETTVAHWPMNGILNMLPLYCEYHFSPLSLHLDASPTWSYPFCIIPSFQMNARIWLKKDITGAVEAIAGAICFKRGSDSIVLFDHAISYRLFLFRLSYVLIKSCRRGKAQKNLFVEALGRVSQPRRERSHSQEGRKRQQA